MQVSLGSCLAQIASNPQTYGEPIAAKAAELSRLDEKTQRAALEAFIEGLRGRFRAFSLFRAGSVRIAGLPNVQVQQQGLAMLESLEKIIKTLESIRSEPTV